ncbi:MAG: hypothetical protein AB7U83_01395 [Vicinamibacterales bacterium]
MTSHGVWVRAAVRLVERFAPDGGTLAGDLLEERARGRSTVWVWRQAFGALVAVVWPPAPLDIRPLTLVAAQPDDAYARANVLLRRRVDIDLAVNPAGHVGGLGITILAALAAVRAPVLLWFLLAAITAGAIFGVLRIRRGRGLPASRAIVPLRSC